MHMATAQNQFAVNEHPTQQSLSMVYINETQTNSFQDELHEEWLIFLSWKLSWNFNNATRNIGAVYMTSQSETINSMQASILTKLVLSSNSPLSYYDHIKYAKAINYNPKSEKKESSDF